MKAVRQVKYGPPEDLRIETVEKPTPKDKQVLIKVHAASINAGDWRGMRADPFIMRAFGGWTKPKDPRLGSDVAGVVEAVGENVTQFKPGDVVFGCAKGSFAEYVLAREAYVVKLPSGVSLEQASTVPVAGLTALQMIRAAGGIKPGQKVAIQGASGGVGLFAVQLAKHYGAHVTAICSTRNLELVRSFGADHVIDYKREDFTRSPDCYDMIFAVNGYHSIFAYRRALKPGGVYICAGGSLTQFFQAMLLGPRISQNGKKLGSMGIAQVNQEDLNTLSEMLASGIITPIIDRTYPFDQVIDAFRHIEQKHAQGKIVLKMV